MDLIVRPSAPVWLVYSFYSIHVSQSSTCSREAGVLGDGDHEQGDGHGHDIDPLFLGGLRPKVASLKKNGKLQTILVNEMDRIPKPIAKLQSEEGQFPRRKLMQPGNVLFGALRKKRLDSLMNCEGL